jgi:hypothetical protein
MTIVSHADDDEKGNYPLRKPRQWPQEAILGNGGELKLSTSLGSLCGNCGVQKSPFEEASFFFFFFFFKMSLFMKTAIIYLSNIIGNY